MATTWTGIGASRHKDAQVRRDLEDIDRFLYEISASIGNISRGQSPIASQPPLGGGGVLLDYFYLPGRTNNQLGYGGTDGGGTLTLSSTANFTKGFIYLGDNLLSAYDEANTRLGVGTGAPSATLHVRGSTGNTIVLRPAGEVRPDPLVAWIASDGSGDWHTHLDEEAADDTDYISVKCDGTQPQISAQNNLPTPSVIPSASNVHTLRARYRRTGSGGTAGSPPDFGDGPGISIAVYKGGIVVTGSWISVVEVEPSGSFTEATVTLSAAQITGLGNYQDLQIWCNWTGSSAGVVAGSEMQVSFLELDCGSVSSQTDIVKFDDNGQDIFPTIRHNTSWKNILATSQTNDMEQWLAADGTTVMLGVTSGGDLHGGNEAASTLNFYSDSNFDSTTGSIRMTATPTVEIRSGATGGTYVPYTFAIGTAGNSAVTYNNVRLILNSTAGGATAGSPSITVDNSNTTHASIATVLYKAIRKTGQTGDLFDFLDSDGSTKLSYVDKDGAFVGPISGSGLSTFDHILIDNATDTDVLLKMTPIATQTANVMEVWNFANTHKDFTVESGGLVTVSSFDATDDDVRFQVRAPSTQTTAKNIFQVVRSYTASPGPYTNLYSAFTVGGTGGMVMGDLLTHGAAVIRLTINQGSGQSVDMFRVRNTADTANFVTIDSAGAVTLSDGAVSAKAIKFTTATSTAGTLLTLDYRAITSRSLIFSMTGTGTANTTLAFPTTTVARTLTFPNGTVTLAALQLAQTFTRTQTITPTVGTEVLVLNSDSSSGLGDTSTLSLVDVVYGQFGKWSPSGLVIGNSGGGAGIFFYPSGTIGSGFGGGIGAATLTAGRVWLFPDFGGAVPIVGANYEQTNQGGDISTNLLTSTSTTNTKWYVNLYLVCTTSGGAGGTVVGTIGWSDVGGARTSQLTRSLASTGHAQTSVFIQVQAAGAITLALDYTTAGGSTERYAVYASITKIG